MNGSLEKRSPDRAHDAATGLQNTSSLVGRDEQSNIPDARSGQASNPRAVREARRELLLADICEHAGFILIQAELVQTYASIYDEAGIRYALKRAVAYFRAAATSANELAALKEGEQ